MARAREAAHVGADLGDDDMGRGVADTGHGLQELDLGLKGLQQRDHLRTTHEALAARARQGTVEFELTDEMLANERAFLERFHQVLAESGRLPVPDTTPPTPTPTPATPDPAPPGLPPKIG